MDWLSFFLGFLAFPFGVAAVLALIAVARRLQSGEPALSAVAPPRGTTLSFSSRLIGEIGERIDSDAGPAAKAS
jgi:hypothetical protein